MLIGEKMTLREYLFVQKMTVRQFAEVLDYSRGHLSAVLNGDMNPGSKLLRNIEKVTAGQVTPENAFSDVKK